MANEVQVRPTVTTGSAAPDPRFLRTCLSRFATGVTVVSYSVGSEPRGATINAFTAVSLDPPLVLVSLGRTARAAEHVSHGQFAVNVLRADQIDVAMQFAGRPRGGARIRWRPGDESQWAPQLEDTIASFQCRPWATYDGGDHILVVGEVVAAEHQPGEPLLFTGGTFAMTGLPLFDAPRVIAPDTDGHPWLTRACRLHDTTQP